MSISRPSSSPWGSIQQCEQLDSGVYRVSTAGHGGIMAHPSLDLSKELRDLARKHDTRSTTWLCFEEDCAYALITLEWRLNQKKDLFPKRETSDLVKLLSSYYPEFLISKNVEVEPEAYKKYLETKLRDQRAHDRDPQLIVSKLRHTGDQIRVWTADDKEYLVTPLDNSNARSLELKDYKIEKDLSNLWTNNLREYLRELPQDLIETLGEVLQISPSNLKKDVVERAYILTTLSENFEHMCTYFRVKDGEADEVASIHVESFPKLLKEFETFVKNMK